MSFKVKKYAMEAGLNRVTVYRRFKKEKGLSPKQVFTQEDLKMAKLMLKRGYSISGIAIQLGFCDRYYFSKWFKRHSGISPRDYRKGVNGKDVGILSPKQSEGRTIKQDSTSADLDTSKRGVKIRR